MTYSVRLVIPPNTTILQPITRKLEVAPGRIKQLRIVHPTGCADLVGIWIEYRSLRLLPVNDDGYYLGNGQDMEFPLDILIDRQPYLLEINGYNEDDTYIHRPTITLSFDFSDFGLAVNPQFNPATFGSVFITGE